MQRDSGRGGGARKETETDGLGASMCVRGSRETSRDRRLAEAQAAARKPCGTPAALTPIPETPAPPAAAGEVRTCAGKCQPCHNPGCREVRPLCLPGHMSVSIPFWVNK